MCSEKGRLDLAEISFRQQVRSFVHIIRLNKHDCMLTSREFDSSYTMSSLRCPASFRIPLSSTIVISLILMDFQRATISAKGGFFGRAAAWVLRWKRILDVLCYSTGLAIAFAIDGICRRIDSGGFRRAGFVQTGTDWLFGPAVHVFQVSNHVCGCGRGRPIRDICVS